MRWARKSDRTLATIYGAALTASATAEAAADVTLRVAAEDIDDPRRQAAAAVRLAMEGEPHAAFTPLPPAEREALALVRVAGLSVREAAEVTGWSVEEVKALLGSALRLLAAPAAAAA
jgi:DNA-directed RNA polymerase specialized sigma24 family protein